jgi:hypothetical protein
MTPILLGDLSQVVLPRDLDKLRKEVSDAISRDLSLDALYTALAEEEPLALLELAAGPKAVYGEASVRAALPRVSVMERHMSPASLYQGLSLVAGEAVSEVLSTAARRHPAAGWLVRLSDRVEATPGEIHLQHARKHPAFASICWAHARAGHYTALAGAGSSGRAEPAAALLSVGQRERAVEAAALALQKNPDAPIVPYFSGVAGPEADLALTELVTKVRSREAAERLNEQLYPFPAARQKLKAVMPGLR